MPVGRIPSATKDRYIDQHDLQEHDPAHRLNKPHSPLRVWVGVGALAAIAVFGILMFTTSMVVPLAL